LNPSLYEKEPLRIKGKRGGQKGIFLKGNWLVVASFGTVNSLQIHRAGHEPPGEGEASPVGNESLARGKRLKGEEEDPHS